MVFSKRALKCIGKGHVVGLLSRLKASTSCDTVLLHTRKDAIIESALEKKADIAREMLAGEAPAECYGVRARRNLHGL